MRRLNTHIIAPQKLAVMQKELVAHCFSYACDVFLINEYPKSGGTWLKLMLADALNLPAWTKSKPVWGSCVMQAHRICKPGRCRTVALLRDGRDVMVSMYYHSFFRNEFQNASYTNLMKQKFRFEDLSDIQANLLPFMKALFDAPASPGFNWLDFVYTSVQQENVVICRYEELRADTPRTLVRLVNELTDQKLSASRAELISEAHSMANMRKRKGKVAAVTKGSQIPEVSFMRKGVVGGWDDAFSDESLDWFEARAGSGLDLLGYTRGRPVSKGMNH